MLSTLDAA